MNVNLADCGNDLADPDYDGLYAEGRSARVACQWLEAVLTGDEDRAQALTTAELAESWHDSLVTVAGLLPFTDSETWGVVSVEPGAVCVEMVTVVNFDKRVTVDDDHTRAPGVVLWLQHEADTWLVAGMVIP